MVKKEEEFQTNRELIREIVDNQKKMIEQQSTVNIELLKQSFIITALNSDNEKHKKYIEKDKKLKWGISGGLMLLMFFKNQILKIFGL